MEFSAWYEAVSINILPAVIESRKQNVQTLVQNATKSDIEALIRNAFRSRQAAASADITKLRNAFSTDADTVGDEELILLSAIALEQLLQKDNTVTCLAALMILTAHCAGVRTIKQPVDIVGLAKNALLNLSDSTRRRPSLAGNKPTLTVDPAEALRQVQALELPNIQQAFTALASAASTAITNLYQRQLRVETNIQRYVRMQDEELDMLWWLQGGRSSTQNKPFAEIDEGHRPFMLSAELADITSTLPGPLSVEAILSRSEVSSTKMLKLADAIQDLPFEWVKEVYDDNLSTSISPVTTPIHDALKRRVEVLGEPTWIPSWTTVCGIDAACEISALEIAMLFYRELMCLRGE